MARRKPARTLPAPSRRRAPGYWLIAVAIATTTFLAYQPAWHGGVLWDDDHHLTAPSLRSMDGLRRIWFEPGATQQYYPVTHSAFWVMHRLWGDDTLGYHLVNVALHALSAALVLAILWRLAVPGAILAAVVFALHPVHVESVAWMTELKNTLSGVLYLGAASAYLAFDRTRRRRHYIAAFGLFGLALLSKSVTATLPAALAVVLWWQRGTLSWTRDLRPLVPLAIVGVSAGLWTAWVERALIGAEGQEFAFGAIERSLIAGRAVWFYLGKIVWPFDLVFSYPRWEIDAGSVVQLAYPAAAFAVLVACWWWRRRTRAPLAAALFYVGTLAPALGFVNVYPFRFSFVADHFQYLASLGVIVAGVAGLHGLARRFGIAAPVSVALGSALAIGLGMLTWRQSHLYASAETLYQSVLVRNPESWLALTNLGRIELERDPKTALARFEAALRLKPDIPEALNNLGNALQRLGRHEAALGYYRDAVRLDSTNAIYQTSLSSALRFLGQADASAAAGAEAVRIDPASAEAQYNLAAARQMQGRTAEALAGYREVIRLNPRFAAAHYGVGEMLTRLGRPEEAISAFQNAVLLAPDLAVARNDLAAALSTLRRYDEAIAEFGAAIRLRPDYADAYFNLGATLQRAGRAADAVEAYGRVLALRPTDVAAHNNLGVALESIGRLQEAAGHFIEALRINPDFAEARANLIRLQQKR